MESSIAGERCVLHVLLFVCVCVWEGGKEGGAFVIPVHICECDLYTISILSITQYIIVCVIDKIDMVRGDDDDGNVCVCECVVSVCVCMLAGEV